MEKGIQNTNVMTPCALAQLRVLAHDLAVCFQLYCRLLFFVCKSTLYGAHISNCCRDIFMESWSSWVPHHLRARGKYHSCASRMHWQWRQRRWELWMRTSPKPSHLPGDWRLGLILCIFDFLSSSESVFPLMLYSAKFTFLLLYHPACPKPHFATIHRVVTHHGHHKPHHGHKFHHHKLHAKAHFGGLHSKHSHHKKAPIIPSHSSSSSFSTSSSSSSIWGRY